MQSLPERISKPAPLAMTRKDEIQHALSVILTLMEFVGMIHGHINQALWLMSTGTGMKIKEPFVIIAIRILTHTPEENLA